MPERAACRFYVRAADVHELAPLKKRVQACFEAGALATGCKADIRWGNTDYLDLKTNWPMAERFEKNARDAGPRIRSRRRISGGIRRLDRYGQCQPSRAVDPSHARRGAGRRHHPQREFARWAASAKGDKA